MRVAVHHVTGDAILGGMGWNGRPPDMGLQLSGDSDGATGITSSEESLACRLVRACPKPPDACRPCLRGRRARARSGFLQECGRDKTVWGR